MHGLYFIVAGAVDVVQVGATRTHATVLDATEEDEADEAASVEDFGDRAVEDVSSSTSRASDTVPR